MDILNFAGYVYISTILYIYTMQKKTRLKIETDCDVFTFHPFSMAENLSFLLETL